MINILKNGNNPSKYVMEYIADTEEDVKNLIQMELQEAHV